MTPAEIVTLVETLRSSGVTHFKSGDLELTLGPVVPRETTEDPKMIHKVQELTSLLKLSDVELMDRLFPEPKEEAEDTAIEAT